MTTISSISADPTGPGPCTRVLTGLSALMVIVTLPWSLAFCIKVSLASPAVTHLSFSLILI